MRSGMGSAGVVVGQKHRQPNSPFNAIGAGAVISPLPQAGPDETLGLTIGFAGGKASGKAMLDSQSLAGAGT